MSARLVGVIGKPQGVKGEIYMRLLTDYPKTIKKGVKLYLDPECGRPLEVENIRVKKKKKPRIFRKILDFPVPDSNNNNMKEPLDKKERGKAALLWIIFFMGFVIALADTIF